MINQQSQNERPVILVTGGAGYIGSQLVRDMASDPRFSDYTIRIYDNLQRQHFCGLMDLPTGGRYEFIEGDILDRLNLGRAMRGAQTVVHLAALVKTPLNFDHPEWTEQVNHWGTASVVDCALSANVPRLLYVSSASVYGPGGPFREADTRRPIGPYAISKLKGEEEAIRSPYTIVRLGTVFGNAPAMRFDGIANRLAYQAGVGRPMVIHGSGEQLRPLIHVRDASAVLRLCLADSGTEGEIINAVVVNPSINRIARTLQAIVPNAPVWYTDQDILTEISFEVDSSKLIEMGFQPQFSLTQGLEEMLERWHFNPASSSGAAALGELDDWV
ncbi:MAG TPA: NAD(P)-dependent oxidoreductase [Thermoflexia bacterium]|nr:NAD(P)-dependent oxidoreductase [Thermoflexia bacterium]